MPRTPEQGRGRFQATREGYGFVTPEGGGEDIFIPAAEVAGSLHGDQVAYLLIPDHRGGPRVRGTILSILARGVAHFTGVVQGPRRRLTLVPDHPKLPPLMRLVGDTRSVENDQRVLCELNDARPGRLPSALYLRTLGEAADPHLDEEIVKAEYGLHRDYPAEALEQAARATRLLARASDATSRRDFRAETVITIDPADARDFDDALSLSRTAEGLWRLRVHIADVAAAVPEGSALDREARRRGNSTYLPGCMIPMLPETLSTDLLSLAPGEDRPVMTVSILVDQDGKITGTRIDEGLIRSRHRLTYGQVQEVLDGGTLDVPEIDGLLHGLDRVTRALRARRLAAGGFDLRVPEIEIRLGEDSRPGLIRRRLQGRSHQIVEDCMILANRVACTFARKREHPYLYRVHGEPDPRALEEFWADLETLYPGVPPKARQDLSGLRHWLASLPDEPATWRLHSFFLRTLKRAIYAATDTGHFGLGLRGYAHFTSPIRRYPDLFNHRVVKWALRHGPKPVPDSWREEAAEVALGCTGTEERSESAERNLVRIKLLRWAEQRLGELYRGRVEAVLPAGFVIELEDPPVTGFAPREEVAHRPHVRTRGRRVGPGRGELALGLPVIVQLVRVDLKARSLLLTVRAAGRKALALQPDELESLVDPWSPAETGRRKGKRHRKFSARGRETPLNAAGRDRRPKRKRRRKKGRQR